MLNDDEESIVDAQDKYTGKLQKALEDIACKIEKQEDMQEENDCKIRKLQAKREENIRKTKIKQGEDSEVLEQVITKEKLKKENTEVWRRRYATKHEEELKQVDTENLKELYTLNQQKCKLHRELNELLNQSYNRQNSLDKHLLECKRQNSEYAVSPVVSNPKSHTIDDVQSYLSQESQVDY